MQAARDSACPDNKVTVRIVNPDVMPVHLLTTFDETREASTGDNESASSLSGRIVTTTVMELFSWEFFFFQMLVTWLVTSILLHRDPKVG